MDRAKTMSMLARGYTRRQIAEELGVCYSQIGHDYLAAMREMAAEEREDCKIVRDVKLEEYAEVKREAWAAWEKSKQQKVRMVRTTFTTATGDKETVTEQRDGSCGDPRFLAIIDKVLQAERELLGLNAPTEVKADVKSQTTYAIDWDAVANHKGGVPQVVEERIRLALGHAPTVNLVSQVGDQGIIGGGKDIIDAVAEHINGNGQKPLPADEGPGG